MVSKISRLSAIRKAIRWTRNGVDWHFHLLSPGCLYNSTREHELFLESKFGAFVARSWRSLVTIAKHLLHLLEKRNVKRVSASSALGIGKVLLQAKHLNDKKIRWHHHLLYPHCVLNKKRGKWAIIFEDPLNNKVTELFYSSYPGKDLNKLELLFYKQ